MLHVTAAPVTEEADAVAIAVGKGEEGGDWAGGDDDNDELKDGEGGEGDGPTVAGRLVVEYVAGGAGGIGPAVTTRQTIRARAASHFQVQIQVLLKHYTRKRFM